MLHVFTASVNVADVRKLVLALAPINNLGRKHFSEVVLGRKHFSEVV